MHSYEQIFTCNITMIFTGLSQKATPVNTPAPGAPIPHLHAGGASSCCGGH